MDEATKMARRHTLNQMKLTAELFQSLVRQIGDPRMTGLANEAVGWATQCEAAHKAGRDFMDEAVRQEMDECR